MFFERLLMNLEKWIKAPFHFTELLGEPNHSVMPSGDAFFMFDATRIEHLALCLPHKDGKTFAVQLMQVNLNILVE